MTFVPLGYLLSSSMISQVFGYLGSENNIPARSGENVSYIISTPGVVQTNEI